MNVQIRKANLYDIQQIDIIEQKLDHRILSYNLLSSTVNKDTYYYFVATIDDNIIGYISAEFLVDHIDILSIAVLKEYRRQNVATLLLNELFNVCNVLQVQDIFLEVRCSNTAAIKFYEKMGFKKISTRKNYYTDTCEDAFIYLNSSSKMV
ncbi:ribosomal protein S18-alanine N-acetyltransferase [Candidatus Proelusimicrobium excrementi]|uniref:ribosomal protein S18-alanine N-acetyltransferase n=1 Tax=Candidatus Proelusimicrobium excrementi TaxID=3416222 RepID=UPI003D1352D0